ncbi:MAG TPA: NAD(P)-dependent oxidoreductase [Actinopolymorphaceae bacterium]
MSEPRHVLVTGAAGNIGSHVTRHLRTEGVAVTAFSNVDYPDGFEAERLLVGDCTKEPDIAAALDASGTDLPPIDAVVHLAALAHPSAGTPYDVYSINVVSTFNVLAQAGAAGIKRAAIASSINAYGVIFNSHRPLPAYLPLDEKIPTDIDDWYSLSKQSDEWTARMAWRRWGIDIVAFRFPFTAPMERIQQMTSHVLDNPDATLREGWSYLDVRDAARAVYLALTMPVSGVHPVLLAAPTTYFAEPTQELLEKWAPDVPRLRSFAGHEVLIDLTVAKTLLGFQAEHLVDLE